MQRLLSVFEKNRKDRIKCFPTYFRFSKQDNSEFYIDVLSEVFADCNIFDSHESSFKLLYEFLFRMKPVTKALPVRNVIIDDHCIHKKKVKEEIE